MRETTKIGDLFLMTTHYINGSEQKVYLELTKIYDLEPYKEYGEIIRITGEGKQNSTCYFEYKFIKKYNLEDYDINNCSDDIIQVLNRKYTINVNKNTIASNKHHNFLKINSVFAVSNLERLLSRTKRRLEFFKKYRPRDRKLKDILK